MDVSALRRLRFHEHINCVDRRINNTTERGKSGKNFGLQPAGLLMREQKKDKIAKALNNRTASHCEVSHLKEHHFFCLEVYTVLTRMLSAPEITCNCHCCEIPP